MTSSSSHQVFTKSEISDFVNNIIKALGHAHKSSPVEETAHIDNRNVTEAERVANDKAILRASLAREKRQLVKQVASDHKATNKDLISALGGDSSITPLQLARLVKADHVPGAID